MSNDAPIIFVDDDADDQFIYKEVCAKIGVINPLRFFSTGASALTYLRETREQPLIIFCDINMPETDGLELRRTINSEEYLRRKSIPFIFYSTAATPRQVRDAYDLTVQGFFLKEQSFAGAQATFKMILDYWSKCYHPNQAGKK